MSETTDKKPNPGSDEAIAMGCTCPVLDNGHGRGYMGQPGIFVYIEGCPLHGEVFEDTLMERGGSDEHDRCKDD